MPNSPYFFLSESQRQALMAAHAALVKSEAAAKAALQQEQIQSAQVRAQVAAAYQALGEIIPLLEATSPLRSALIAVQHQLASALNPPLSPWDGPEDPPVSPWLHSPVGKWLGCSVYWLQRGWQQLTAPLTKLT